MPPVLRRSASRLALWGALTMPVVTIGCGALLGIEDVPTPLASDGGLDSPNNDGPTSDGGSDAPSDVDSDAPVIKSCPHGAPFVSVELVAGLETTDVWSARFGPDEKTIYVSVPAVPASADGFDLYSAGRAATDKPFGVLQKLSISSSTDDYWPSVSADEKVMFFESGIRPDGGVGSSRIWFASRITVPGNFNSTLLDYFATVPETVTEGVPYLNGPGRRLYWASIGREGKTTLDIWAADVTAGGSIVTPARLDLSTSNDDSFPVATDDDLELFFGHDTPTEGDDIYVSVRKPGEATFPAPVSVVGPINTVADREWSSWVSPDSCRLYFIRKSGSAETARLYVAERAKP